VLSGTLSSQTRQIFWSDQDGHNTIIDVQLLRIGVDLRALYLYALARSLCACAISMRLRGYVG
jgi:hypothetical protein